MSSRQIKWMREQIAKQNGTKTEEINEYDLVDSTSDSIDFSILKEESSTEIIKEDSSNEISPITPEPPINTNIALPPPPSKSNKNNKNNKNNQKQVSQEDDIAALEELALKRQMEQKVNSTPIQNSSSGTPITGFDIQQLNLIRELKAKLGSTQFDECLKVPKAASSIRFMGRRKRWPNPVPPYFIITSAPDINPEAYRITLTEKGSGESEVFRALERINDQQ